LEPGRLGFEDNSVALGELDQALGLGLDANVSKRALRVGGDAPLSGGVNANDAAFRDLELVAIHVEPALAFDHNVNLLIPLVGMDEGDTDARGQFVDGDFRAGKGKLVVERNAPFDLDVSD
jgi:hypothetical protein